MYKALDIAKYILAYCTELRIPISNLKLQKILYFVWIEHYKKTQQPLFSENIAAWRWGPVVPEVYFAYRRFAGGDILEFKKPDLRDIGANLEIYVAPYITMRIGELVNKTHKEGKPWKLIYKDGSGEGAIIPFKLIIDMECATTNGR